MPISDTSKAVLALLAAVGIVGGAGFLILRNAEPDRDRAHCAAERETGHTIVVVDKTDKWNDAQAQRLEEHIFRLVDKHMAVEERLSIFVFADQFKRGFAPSFSFCKPTNQADDIIKSKKHTQSKYHQAFGKPLEEVLTNLKVPEEGPCSPILEVLGDILGRWEVKSHRGPTRLVLISDMIENSRLFSFFRQNVCLTATLPAGTPRPPNVFDEARIIRHFNSEKEQILTQGVSVLIFQVPTQSEDYLRDARERWTRWFAVWGMRVTWERL